MAFRGPTVSPHRREFYLPTSNGFLGFIVWLWRPVDRARVSDVSQLRADGQAPDHKTTK